MRQGLVKPRKNLVRQIGWTRFAERFNKQRIEHLFFDRRQIVIHCFVEVSPPRTGGVVVLPVALGFERRGQ